MNSDDDCSNLATPPELCDVSEQMAEELLPRKSTKVYKKSYDNFMAWKETKKAESFSQRVLLAYFNELSRKYKPTTLWSEFSKLKTMIQHNHQIDINYTDLKRFLKRAEHDADGETKKAHTFSSDDIERFLNTAPDDPWLAIKVSAIFGFLGACRREELRNVTTDDLEIFYPDSDKDKKNPMLHVSIPKTKTNKPRSFTLEGEYFAIYQRYDNLRSKVVKGKKEFFVHFQKGHCTNKVIGINSFGLMPKKVATFLGLKRPETYTGHAWRRTSATLLVEGGADMATLKRHGGWRSDTVAEGYVESSTNEKRKIYNRITSSIHLKDPSTTSTSTTSTSASPLTASSTTVFNRSEEMQQEAPTGIVSPRGGLSLQISNCSNCSFQFHNAKEQ